MGKAEAGLLRVICELRDKPPDPSELMVYLLSRKNSRQADTGSGLVDFIVRSMALLDIESVSPQMNNDFNVKVLNYKIVEDGKFALYTIQLTVDGYTWAVERRYSEFDAFDMRRFSDRKKSFLPPKKLIRNLCA
ncbi:unnamed protein product [Nippostrongylus brasiliensis]|uniref:PX domain-containing protein n=1 Tax=Nippostrongylus brasiliensis TaxID=27835 RepID=A0A0N4XI04_NIPBR|nr:unnamed protein product [Nippostrongylus brasiliensis]